MLAICSDIDRTTVERFRRMHRFLNTREATPLGEGLGLDIADSLWVFKGRNSSDISLLVDDVRGDPESYADELTAYAQAGWIDTLHTYGNFTTASDSPAFKRRLAAIAIDELVKRDIRLPIWVNHGSRTNVQNIGRDESQQGDVPAAAAYHTDLLVDYGVRFCWNHLHGQRHGLPDPLSPLLLRDGRRLWGFARFIAAVGAPAEEALLRDIAYDGPEANAGRTIDDRRVAMVWWPSLLDLQLTDAILDDIVDRGDFSIVGQHLGDWGLEPDFPQTAVNVLQKLQRRQDAREILVARTSRVLEYARVTKHLRFEVRGTSEQTYIDIVAVNDPVLGAFVPKVDQIRGVTFYVPHPGGTYLLLNGRAIPGSEVIRSPDDGAGPSIGVKWFEPDYTDHAAVFDGVTTRLSRSAAEAARTAGGSWVHTLLLAPSARLSSGVGGPAYLRAVEHASRKYANQTDYYERIIRRIGFVDRDRVLDVGSGVGHWSIALAAHNRQVVAVDPDPAVIEVARRMGAHHGVDERLAFLNARIEETDFRDRSVNLVYCHNALMFADHEAALANLARWTAPGGLLYLAYATGGARVQDIVTGLTENNPRALDRGLTVLLASARARAGVGGTDAMLALSRAEVLRMCTLLGFEFLKSAGVHDGPRSFHGIPATFDVVARRRGGPAGGDNGLGHGVAIHRLIQAGLPRRALEAIARGGVETATQAAELVLRARLRSGTPIESETELLARLPERRRSLLQGMSSQLRGDHEAALGYYGAAPPEDARAVLSALCLLELGRYDDVVAAASGSAGDAEAVITQFALRTAALLRARGPRAASQPAIELLRRQLETGRADASQVAAAIERLS